MEIDKDQRIAELESELESSKKAKKIIAWINIVGGIILISILTYGLLRKIFG